MSQPFLLTKMEKKRVIEMYLQNKTISEIAKKVPMSFRDISQIIKTYLRKKELQAKREENNQNGQVKKPSLSSQGTILTINIYRI
jgi:hypothetical protein